MRKNFGAKPYTYPAAGVYYCHLRRGWNAGRHERGLGRNQWRKRRISMCLSPGHKTVKNILARKAFTVSMADAEHVIACDYVGIVSGNDVPDKFAKAGFHALKSEFVDAPLIEELPMAVECRLLSYDPDSCRLVGEIVNVNADERILDKDGNIDPDQAAADYF